MFGGSSAVFVALFGIGLLLINTQPDISHYPNNTDYELKIIDLPPISGWPLSIFVFAAETWPFSSLLGPFLRQSTQIHQVRDFASTLTNPPIFLPLVEPTPEQVKIANQEKNKNLLKEIMNSHVPQSGPFKFITSEDYVQAYKKGVTTPSSVARKLILNIKQAEYSNERLGAFSLFHEDKILAQAEASTKRYLNNQPLGELDGVPVGIKEELTVEGYTSSVGTTFLSSRPAALAHSSVVKRLASHGALIVGTTHMQEIGFGVLGISPHGVSRNPYNMSYFPGGSSSGSASAVGAGLVPFAIAADGGGSIRIPASLTGLVGLKPTFGRVSGSGSFGLCSTVGHVGPIAATVKDAALMYAAIAGHDEDDPNTKLQPHPHLKDWTNIYSLSGLRIGVYSHYFDDADPLIVSRCKQVLDKLTALNASIVKIHIEKLSPMLKGHTVTIAAEIAASVDKYYFPFRKEFSPATRINLVLGNSLTARDYLAAQKIRQWSINQFEKIFSQVDVIATPTTAMLAPRIPEYYHGFIDSTSLSELAKYSGLANFAGMPAITVPVGYHVSSNLPIGIQFMARHWEEHLLFRLGLCVEQYLERAPPSLYFSNFHPPLAHLTHNEMEKELTKLKSEII